MCSSRMELLRIASQDGNGKVSRLGDGVGEGTKVCMGALGVGGLDSSRGGNGGFLLDK